MTSKFCNRCKEHKDTSDFNKNKAKADGLADQCRDCCKELAKIYRENNKEKISAGKSKCYQAKREQYKQKTKDWVRKNPEARKEILARYYENNRENILEKQSGYRTENKDVCRERIKDWESRNPAKVRAKYSKRRSVKLSAQPNWLSEDHKKQIEDVYLLAKDCEQVSGETYHVDHIVPLQGKAVCGLHVPWNLQVLPSDINVKKGNKFNDW